MSDWPHPFHSNINCQKIIEHHLQSSKGKENMWSSDPFSVKVIVIF